MYSVYYRRPSTADWHKWAHTFDEEFTAEFVGRNLYAQSQCIEWKVVDAKGNTLQREGCCQCHGEYRIVDCRGGTQ